MTQNSALQVFRGGWNELQNAVFTDNTSNALPSLRAFFIKPDGTEIFVINGTTNAVETYPLSRPHDPDTIGTTPSDIFPITVDTQVKGIWFRDDAAGAGTIMYLVGGQNQILYGFVLPTPWKPSSNVDAPETLDLDAAEFSAEKCSLSRDGDLVLVTNTAFVLSYPLPTNWSVASGNPTTPAKFIPAAPTVAQHAILKREGDKMYIGESLNKKIAEYNLPINKDITSAVLISEMSTDPQRVDNMQFRSNGQELLTLDNTTDLIMRFHTNQDWETDDASHFTNSFDLDPAFQHRAVQWKPGGSEFLTLANGVGDQIQSHIASKPWNQTDATSSGIFLLSAIGEAAPESMFWLKGGKTGYVVGNIELVRQISATTGWDPTTMSDAGKSFSIASEINLVTGLWFEDNTDENNKRKWYAFGRLGPVRTIAEYEMTGEDIATSNLIQTKALTSTGVTGGIFFQQNGRLLYFLDRDNLTLEIMSMSTPGDISTITPFDSLDVSAQFVFPVGLFIREDNGKKLYITDLSPQKLISFDVSEEFNNSLITTLGDELITTLEESLVYV